MRAFEGRQLDAELSRMIEQQAAYRPRRAQGRLLDGAQVSALAHPRQHGHQLHHQMILTDRARSLVRLV